jgi:hypothetical protein
VTICVELERPDGSSTTCERSEPSFREMPTSRWVGTAALFIVSLVRRLTQN